MGPRALLKYMASALLSGWRGSYGWVSYDRIGYNGGFHPTLQRWRGCAGRQDED